MVERTKMVNPSKVCSDGKLCHKKVWLNGHLSIRRFETRKKLIFAYTNSYIIYKAVSLLARTSSENNLGGVVKGVTVLLNHFVYRKPYRGI